MPRGRHGGRSKVKKELQATAISGDEQHTPSRPAFTALEKTHPLLTLLFDTKTAQHAALSRIEAFYESTLDAKTYLTLEQAKTQRQCQHYEAFNFPIEVVRRWLAEMEKTHFPQGRPVADVCEEETFNSSTESNTSFWWRDFCNDQENHLLEYLNSLGAFEGLNRTDQEDIAPIYLISTLATKQSSLRHERLHFLYYISPSYRAKVKEEYDTIPAKSLKIIERDLAMRKYSPEVWIDEFQAYVSEDPGEFGSSIKEDCQEISRSLRKHQDQLWNEYKIC